MRLEPIRKCNRFVNVTNFDLRHDVRLTQDIGLTQQVALTQYIKLGLIHHYGQWIQQQIDDGWDAYLFSFMFSQLPGSLETKTQQMEREILRWYGRLATRTVRKPRSPQWAPLLPKAIFVPDLPVYNNFKQTLPTLVFNA